MSQNNYKELIPIIKMKKSIKENVYSFFEVSPNEIKILLFNEIKYCNMEVNITVKDGKTKVEQNNYIPKVENSEIQKDQKNIKRDFNKVIKYLTNNKKLLEYAQAVKNSYQFTFDF